MIAYLLQVSFCLAFFYGFYYIALRKETMFDTNRMYLLVTLAISLTLPLIKIYIDHRDAQTSVVLPSYVYLGSYISDFSTSIAAPPSKTFPWGKLMMAAYITGVAVMSFRLLLALKQIMDIRRNGSVMILSGHRCIISDQVRSPFSFFKTIYLPKDHAFTEAELNEVIAHELAHVRAHHTWDVILMELACIKLWPSPMIFLYRKSLKEVHEYVADAAVLKDTPWENYAQLLVNQQHNHLQNILSNQLIYSQLKKRLLMMNQERSGAAARYKYLGLIPLLLLALVFFSFREKPSTNEVFNTLIGDSIITGEKTLYVTNDHRYFMGTKEITKNEIASAMADVTKGEADPRIKVIIDDRITTGELAEIDDLGYKQKIRVTFYTAEDEEFREYKSALIEGRSAFQNDSLPETHVVAFRALEPEGTKDISSFPGGASAEEMKRLGYERSLPIFPGCELVPFADQGVCGMTKLGEYINEHLIYPESLKESGLEGKVVVGFVVGADGYIKDEITITESLHPDADKAVVQLIQGMNSNVGRWMPARKEGKSYDAEMHLPVKFALDQNSPKAEPLKQVDVNARFPGCEHITDATERNYCAQEKMMKFVYSNIMYPKEDREKGIEGIGVVQFVITSTGVLSDIKVLRSPSPGIQAELERVMNLMAGIPEKWSPAQKDGKTVDYQLILPVKFKLQDDESIKESPAPSSSVAKTTSKSISVIPNPASESITVSIFKDTHTLKIFDSTGKLLITKDIAASSAINEIINISALKNGQYVVQVISDNESLSAAFTVVK